MHTQRTKIGPCKGVPHRKIWIEGKHLAASGFTVGTEYIRIENDHGEGLLLARTDGKLQMTDPKRYKVSGKGDHPIIDISGAIVPRLFPEPLTHVTVTFREDTICIEPTE